MWVASNHLSDLEGAPDDGSLTASCAIIPVSDAPSAAPSWRCGGRAGSAPGRPGTGRATPSSRSPTTTSPGACRVPTACWHSERPGPGGLLHAPLRTAMHRRVEETLDARVTIHHTGHDGSMLFAGTGAAAGLEVFGDTDRLIAL
ncbi:hypothetical protein G7085_02040 [Tessaracoccus sp. HDW20]|uniref:hypothetical protein n=1 Tax=Tessaracoccus coleopterorum TaxID=2714950 RepID=UPI0018D2A85A|nr:hypothetical protein [Tessaracoccus coleopterorum]NHB83866.1 hypothetical protein [Tessaracoccus coleopterorum]